MAAPSWTAEKDARVESFIRQGLSAKEIGLMMGCSKCAIIGRVGRIGKAHLWRMHQDEREAPMCANTNGVRKGVRKRKKKVSTLPVELQQALVAPVETGPLPELVTILELKPDSCRWIVGRDREAIYCGVRNDGFSRYCGYHHTKAVVRR